MPRDSALSTPVGDVSWRVVPATMLVRCAGREFSVPRRCMGHRVRLPLEPGGRLGTYDGGELVTAHDTAAPGGPIACREGDYAEAMADKPQGRRRGHRGAGQAQPRAAGWARRGRGVVTGPEGSVSERIRGNLEELGLDAMASSAPEHSRFVATGAKSFPEALLEMTDAQVAAVRERDLGRRVEKASFPYVKTLRNFDSSFQPSIPRGVVEDLATLGFLDRHESVVIVGSPGVGKTHIAVAPGVEAIHAHKLTRFTDCQRLVSDLAHAAGKDQLERRLRFYAHLSLPIVDEMGCLDVDKQGADLLFQLVSRRYERRSTIVTTNVGMGSWARVFGDPVVASAIADGLCHRCHIIRMTRRPFSTKDLAPQDRAPPVGAADSGVPR